MIFERLREAVFYGARGAFVRRVMGGGGNRGGARARRASPKK